MTPQNVPQLTQRVANLENAVADLMRNVAEQGTDIARVQSDVSSNTEMIRALAPLVSQLATVAEAQRNLKDAMTELRHDWRQDVKHFDEEIEKISVGQDRDQRDSRNFRRVLLGIGITAILSPVGTLIVALLNQP
jgi:chromosome segregation ATPase